MSDKPEIRKVDQETPERQAVMAFVESMRLATADAVSGAGDPRQTYSLVMTAAAIFSGTVLGTLIVMGEASDGDKKRATDAMMKNFRSGIDIGKRRAMRAIRETAGGNA